MVGGTAALPQARGLDGGEPDEEDAAAEVYVGHRKTKRRKQGHGDKVGGCPRVVCVCAGRTVVGAQLRAALDGCGASASSVPRPLPDLACPAFCCVCVAQASKRDWIVRKKAQQRSRGYTAVKPDSKYTGRKRKDRF